jgi:hypothetical protein
MTWYTASIITVIKLREGTQDTFPVFEDFYLIEAPDRPSALQKAETAGLALQKLDDKLHFNNQPARREFLGIRKLRSIYNPSRMDMDTMPPVDGTELSHSYFEVGNEAELTLLAEGKRVSVEYVDDDS